MSVIDEKLNKEDEARVDELLSLYRVDEPHDDLADNILRKAAMFPRQDKERASVLEFFIAPIRTAFFSKEYMPITFAIVMFCLMVLVTFEEQFQTRQNASYNNYASIMGIDDMPEIVAINRSTQSDDYVLEFQEEIDEMMMQDLNETYDI
jgi:hypothetical protein